MMTVRNQLLKMTVKKANLAIDEVQHNQSIVACGWFEISTGSHVWDQIRFVLGTMKWSVWFWVKAIDE